MPQDPFSIADDYAPVVETPVVVDTPEAPATPAPAKPATPQEPIRIQRRFNDLWSDEPETQAATPKEEAVQPESQAPETPTAQLTEPTTPVATPTEEPETPVDWTARAKEQNLDPQYFGDIQNEKQFFEALGKKDLVYNQLLDSQEYQEFRGYSNQKPETRVPIALKQAITNDLSKKWGLSPTSARIMQMAQDEYENMIDEYVTDGQLTDAGKDFDENYSKRLSQKVEAAQTEFHKQYETTVAMRNTAEKSFMGNLQSFKVGEVSLTQKEQNELKSMLFADYSTWNPEYLRLLSSDQGKEMVDNIIWSRPAIRSRIIEDIKAQAKSDALKQNR